MYLRWIKFHVAYTVQGLGGPSYQKGQVVQLPLHSARHFINRGVAVYVEKPEPPKPKPVIKPKEEPKPAAEPEAKKEGPEEKKVEPPSQPKRTSRSKTRKTYSRKK